MMSAHFESPIVILSLLEECGADLNYVNSSDETLLSETLHYLSDSLNKSKKWLLLLNHLFSKNVDLNKTNKYGDTQLHEYAEINNLFIVKELVRHGADLTIKNCDGQTPLDVAKQNNACSEIIELLTPPVINHQESADRDFIKRFSIAILLLKKMAENTQNKDTMLEVMSTDNAKDNNNPNLPSDDVMDVSCSTSLQY